MELDLGFIYGLIASLGLGALIGMERERRRDEDAVLVGIRTFPLVSTSGYVITYIAVMEPSMSILVITGLILFGSLALLLVYVRQELGFPGFTTTLALIVTYLIGVLVGYGMILEAVIVGVATTLILLSKERLHQFAKVLTEEEILGALQFITIAFILYPLTMDLEFSGALSVFGKGESLDLNMALLIVLFVSAISFASFLVVRWQGPSRGLRFSGLLGGLVNSEAATASFCGLVRKRMDMLKAAAAGIVLANATMFLRNLAVCAFADPTLETAYLTALPLIAISVLGMALGWTMRVEGDRETLRVGSPFAIGPALKFGALFMIISGIALGIQDMVGGEAIYLTALGGFVSSAAVVASVSSLALTGALDPWIAAETVLLACGISSLNKIIIVRVMCPELSRRAVLGLVVSTIASLLGAALLFLIRTLP